MSYRNGLLGYLEFTRYSHQRAWLTALAVIVCAASFKIPFIQHVNRKATALARRRGLCVLLVGIFSFAITASLAIRRGIPLPEVHDEFSYLLASDTFAHGRLTNPSPAVWQPFETMHVLVRPTYMSKYPPGQGLFLALGQVLTGRPIGGVWISGALAAMAIYWMLLSFVSPRWALLGALLTTIHPQMLEWGQRYWGGYVAVLGGALLLGGVARLFQEIRATSSIAMAMGIFILAISRPFEGMVLSAIMIIGVAIKILRDRSFSRKEIFQSLILPSAIILLPGAIWMGYYNWRITGDFWRMPYQAHQEQYAAVPLFIFQRPLPAKTYNHKELEQFYAHDQRFDQQGRDYNARFGSQFLKDMQSLYAAIFGNASALLFLLLILPWAILVSRQMRWLLGALVIFVIALLPETFVISPHYAAPAAGLVIVILVLLLKRLHSIKYPLGAYLVRVVIATFLIGAGVWWLAFFNWKQDPNAWQSRRNWVENEFLASQPGKHLAIVRYAGHNVHEEWVNNGADLENAKVVWAREMAPEQNRKLFEHYDERQIWLVEPDSPADQIKPYDKRSTQ